MKLGEAIKPGMKRSYSDAKGNARQITFVRLITERGYLPVTSDGAISLLSEWLTESRETLIIPIDSWDIFGVDYNDQES